MNTKNKKLVLLVGIASCILNCSGATNIMERVKEYFAPEVMADPGFYVNENSHEYQSFLSEVNEFNHDGKQEEIVEVMNYLVSSITSLVVNVSTNEVRQGPDLNYLRDRGDVFCSVMFEFWNQPATTNVCLDIAHYLGGVKSIPFPSDLARTRKLSVYYNPDPKKMAEWKAKEEAWWRKRDHQAHVYSDNASVKYYREKLFEACGRTLPDSKKIMSPEAFIAFTNEIVKASNASLREQEILFDELKDAK